MTAERGGPPDERDREPVDPDPGITDEIDPAIEDDFGDDFGADIEADLAGGGDSGEPEAKQPGQDGDAEPAAPAGEEADQARQRALQETVEADVLALGDAEEAAEKAAAAEPRPEAAPPAPKPEPAGEEEGKSEEEAGEAEEDARQPTEEAPAPAAVATAEPPPPARRIAPVPTQPEHPAEDDSAPRSKLWLRFVAASFVIVVSMATATAVTGLIYLTDIARGLGGIEGVQKQLASVDGGSPQNILILGSDKRPGDPSARSDTALLIRLDPDQDAIALFSLPRDLKVNIPGYGVDRLNAAYSIGGPKLTLKTVSQVTGLDIHHVVNVNFDGFYRAVNAIDCVYVDVDRRYYVPPEADYAEIDIEAGYQLLCGERALQYVRFRHSDTDITRTARQQDFLREARQKMTPGRLFRDREDLIDIFKRYTTSDIDDAGTMLEVFKLFLSVADAPVREIHFEGNVGPSYITFSQEQMKQAIDQFLGLEDTAGPVGGGIEGAEDSEGGGGDGGDEKPKPEPEPELIDSGEFGAQIGTDFAKQTGFPVYYPTKLTPGAQFSDDSRPYEIEDEDGKIRGIYKFVIQTPLLGEYYGVSGTTWEDPPILENPSETREIGNREFDLFYDGDRLRMVSWKTDDGAYWLSNTLLQSIDEAQMLEIAETMQAAKPPKK
jgi:LCP family protein required for cell wall assembly